MSDERWGVSARNEVSHQLPLERRFPTMKWNAWEAAVMDRFENQSSPVIKYKLNIGETDQQLITPGIITILPQGISDDASTSSNFFQEQIIKQLKKGKQLEELTLEELTHLYKSGASLNLADSSETDLRLYQSIITCITEKRMSQPESKINIVQSNKLVELADHLNDYNETFFKVLKTKYAFMRSRSNTFTNFEEFLTKFSPVTGRGNPKSIAGAIDLETITHTEGNHIHSLVRELVFVIETKPDDFKMMGSVYSMLRILDNFSAKNVEDANALQTLQNIKPLISYLRKVTGTQLVNTALSEKRDLSKNQSEYDLLISASNDLCPPITRDGNTASKQTATTTIIEREREFNDAQESISLDNSISQSELQRNLTGIAVKTLHRLGMLETAIQTGDLLGPLQEILSNQVGKSINMLANAERNQRDSIITQKTDSPYRLYTQVVRISDPIYWANNERGLPQAEIFQLRRYAHLAARENITAGNQTGNKKSYRNAWKLYRIAEATGLSLLSNGFTWQRLEHQIALLDEQSHIISTYSREMTNPARRRRPKLLQETQLLLNLTDLEDKINPSLRDNVAAGRLEKERKAFERLKARKETQ